MQMNDVIISLSPPQRLALSYLEPNKRQLLTLFLVFDSRLQDVYFKMSEVMIAQIRLAWWRDTIVSESKPKSEPLVAMIDETITLYPEINITKILLSLIDAWEIFIISEGDMKEDQLREYANNRGGLLFEAIAEVCKVNELSEDFAYLGEIWALSFLFQNDREVCEEAITLAFEKYKMVDLVKTSREIRALTILSYPIIRQLCSKDKYKPLRQEGLLYGLSYIWHAISGRWSFDIR